MSLPAPSITNDPNGRSALPYRSATRQDITTELGESRQTLLDTLPMAVGIVVVEDDNVAAISASNALLRQLLSRPVLPTRSRLLRVRLMEFFRTNRGTAEFEWDEGGVGGRHFAVTMSRLPTSSAYRDRCLLSFRERTAEVEMQRSLRAEMLHDSLTGLPNRLAFDEAIERAMADASGADYAVLAADLTRFSRFNESMGSVAGDELIITVARRIVSALREGDLLARVGGNEFAILLRLSEGPGDALHAARRIQATLSTPVRLSELEIRVDCAIGCALMSDRVETAEDLVRNAHIALKRAKQSHRIEVYRPGEVNAARRRFSLETDLRRAIDANQLTLAYQPLVELDRREVIGFEALARWTHADHGPVSPAEFITVAEESGLIVPLGRWALEEATRTLAAWDRRAGRRLACQVAVNISAVQLARDNVSGAAAEALAASGLDGARLKLELTESSIVADPDRAARVLEELKALDCQVAMDDFGTGFSSLAALQRLPIDILKIDRSFVVGMLGDRDSIAIVRAILSLADALGMTTTAEGIETGELAQTLGAMGCTVGQGYYFARPMPADEAFDFLTR